MGWGNLRLIKVWAVLTVVTAVLQLVILGTMIWGAL